MLAVRSGARHATSANAILAPFRLGTARRSWPEMDSRTDRQTDKRRASLRNNGALLVGARLRATGQFCGALQAYSFAFMQLASCGSPASVHCRLRQGEISSFGPFPSVWQASESRATGVCFPLGWPQSPTVCAQRGAMCSKGAPKPTPAE